jgi:hypothetical protein
MYYITYNDVITPHAYVTRDDAVAELKKVFSDIDLGNHDIAYWPSVSARGHTKIEIKKYDGELE